MEDERTSVSAETSITAHQPNRSDLQAQQAILDQISKNTRDLESFLNINIKLRGALTELAQSYINNNEERLKFFYVTIKECLKSIENGNMHFSKLLNSVQHSQNNASKEDFNSIFAEKNNEISESLFKLEFNHKYHFTISVFKNLLDNKRDEILKEILKDDYIMHIKNTVKIFILFFKYCKILAGFKQPPLSTDKINDIPPEIIEELNKKFGPAIHITKNDRDLWQLVNIVVQNSFIIQIKTSKEFPAIFEMNVSSIDEYSNLPITFERKERKYLNLLKKTKVEEKSKYKVMRKISLLLEDRLFVLLRYLKPPFRMGFYLFIHWIQSFSDLFKKKCSFCKQIAKLNLQDKCFYPPFYKFMDLETENHHHFHEECYNYINNAFI